MSGWSRLARRIRVPAGFVFAAIYLWLARPSWPAIALGAGVAAVGLGVRGLASGFVRKDAELTVSGPYAYTRNPLYLGSLIVAAGFAIAARSWWIVLGMAVIFVAIYVPVILQEEAYLRAQFPEFHDYVRRVPRLLPRLTSSNPTAISDGERVSTVTTGSFSRELYWRHREYNAFLGTLAMLAALAIKLAWVTR